MLAFFGVGLFELLILGAFLLVPVALIVVLVGVLGRSRARGSPFRCPCCRGPVSPEAKACPHCGHPISPGRVP